MSTNRKEKRYVRTFSSASLTKKTKPDGKEFYMLKQPNMSPPGIEVQKVEYRHRVLQKSEEDVVGCQKSEKDIVEYYDGHKSKLAVSDDLNICRFQANERRDGNAGEIGFRLLLGEKLIPQDEFYVNIYSKAQGPAQEAEPCQLKFEGELICVEKHDSQKCIFHLFAPNPTYLKVKVNKVSIVPGCASRPMTIHVAGNEWHKMHTETDHKANDFPETPQDQNVFVQNPFETFQNLLTGNAQRNENHFAFCFDCTCEDQCPAPKITVSFINLEPFDTYE